jgi:hypothetical protein
MITSKSDHGWGEGREFTLGSQYYMNYNDDLIERPKRIDANLKIRIRSIVKGPRKHNDWDEVADEIISRFHPNLSKLEKIVCRCIVQAGRDLNGPRLPSEEIEARLPTYSEVFNSKYRIRNSILILCNQGIVNWMTNLYTQRYRNGKVFRISHYQTYGMNPEIIHDIAKRAYIEILNLSTENTHRGSFPIKYKKYLTWLNFPPEFDPILN